MMAMEDMAVMEVTVIMEDMEAMETEVTVDTVTMGVMEVWRNKTYVKFGI